MYNRYIPNGASYTRITEEDASYDRPAPPEAHPRSKPLKAEKQAGSTLSKLLKSLKLDDLDSGDILLLLILLFLFLEGDDTEMVITLGL